MTEQTMRAILYEILGDQRGGYNLISLLRDRRDQCRIDVKKIRGDRATISIDFPIEFVMDIISTN